MGVAIIDAAAEPLRRDARHVGAVGEGRPHDVILSLDAELPGPERQHIVLELEFAAAEDRIVLRIDRLVELEPSPDLARGVFAGVAGQAAIDETVEPGVVARQFEPERPGRAPQADLDRFRRLDSEVGIADIERHRCIVPAA